MMSGLQAKTTPTLHHQIHHMILYQYLHPSHPTKTTATILLKDAKTKSPQEPRIVQKACQLFALLCCKVRI